MKINRDNYESFFLDFLEGKLKENQIDEFLDFLEQNQDLKDELHQFESVHLPEEQILFTDKGKLYKSDSDQMGNHENKLIAYLEGDLEKEERIRFEAYLASHQELQKEYNLFAKTRLIPDTGIRMPDKHKLYRKSGSVVAMNWVLRAAAVVILLWGINALYRDNNQPEGQKMAQQVAIVTPKRVVPPVTKIAKEKLILEEPKPLKASQSISSRSSHKQSKERPEESKSLDTSPVVRDLSAIASITPKTVYLQLEPIENHLAVAVPVLDMKINDQRKVMTVEEFLASRAKKVGNESLLSAERIARLGLGVASELSGSRIGYKEVNGRITSLDFESRLLAFSIPLGKR